jgi:hypothetical protein
MIAFSCAGRAWQGGERERVSLPPNRKFATLGYETGRARGRNDRGKRGYLDSVLAAAEDVFHVSLKWMLTVKSPIKPSTYSFN